MSTITYTGLPGATFSDSDAVELYAPIALDREQALTDYGVHGNVEKLVDDLRDICGLYADEIDEIIAAYPIRLPRNYVVLTDEEMQALSDRASHKGSNVIPFRSR